MKPGAWISEGATKGVAMHSEETSREPEIDTLVEVACGRDLATSLDAARRLAALPEPGRFLAMTLILGGTNSLVGDLAAHALGEYGERGVDPLIEALTTARPLTQMKIVDVLEHLGSQRAVRPLMDLLAKTDFSVLRYMIIQALGSIGDSQAVPLIRSFADDSDHHVRERVRIALELLEES